MDHAADGSFTSLFGLPWREAPFRKRARRVANPSGTQWTPRRGSRQDGEALPAGRIGWIEKACEQSALQPLLASRRETATPAPSRLVLEGQEKG